MKNQSLLRLALLLPLSVAGCGRPEVVSPVSSPTDTPTPASANAAMPETTEPKDLPPCPGFVLLESSKGDAQSGSSVLISSQTVPTLLDFYTTNLAADGWILGASVAQGGAQNLQFRKGARFLRFQIGPSGNPAGMSRVLVAWTQPVETGGVREAYEPEPEAPSDVDAGSREW